MQDSWEDDEDDDLGEVPPPPLQYDVTYAQAITVLPSSRQRMSHHPRHVKLASKQKQEFSTFSSAASASKQLPPAIVVAAVRQQQQTVPVRTIVPVHLPPAKKQSSTVVVDIIKCDNCHERRGHLKFTEDHVEKQYRSEGIKPLEKGTYCQECVKEVSPPCRDFEICGGRRMISPPDARYPFKLFCEKCVAEYLKKPEA